MPRKRKTNKHLPERVYFNHNIYFFVDRSGKWINLGKSLQEALFNYAEMFEAPNKNYLMGDLFDRYISEILCKNNSHKSLSPSQKNKLRIIVRLRENFGEYSPELIKPKHIYQYMDLRGKIAPIAANREKEVLSHVFSMAIRWGIVEKNPCKEVRGHPEKGRDRYIEDWEFLSVHTLASPLIKNLMELAYLTSFRKGDILSLTTDCVTEKGLRNVHNKTGFKQVILWTPQLQNTVEKILKQRPCQGSNYLFCTKSGDKYSESGISSIWKRIMNKALKADNTQGIKEKFTFHDIRRKAATDAEAKYGREYARQLLGHTTQQMTAQYISGEQTVTPLSLEFKKI